MPVKRLISSYGLENHGITNVRKVHWNHNTPMLYEDIIRNNEGYVAHHGPVVVRTGLHTGRAAKDKFIVHEEGYDDKIWWGKVNRAFDEAKFEVMFRRVKAYLQGRDLYVQDCFAGYDEKYRMPVRIITETAWHSLFARNLFIQAGPEQLTDHKPEFTVLQVPGFLADPEVDGTASETFILLSMKRKLVLIGGTAYAGEIKKSIFSVMNFELPQKGVLSMHCSANVGKNDDVAIFFGLSGTGKTTLSTDPDRELIGDDEHGWGDDGVFNFEGGCYAKMINLSPEAEPEIYSVSRKFGTVLENVGIDPITRRLDLNDDSLTENTRAGYPITHLPNAKKESNGGHPKNIVMLTADAFGVMPPIAKLTPEQAMYHFISGYTAKLAGTEKGVTEPSATFSACFGAPFMMLHPSVYAELLAEKIRKHNVRCWLVNTGWSGGPYGKGQRMKIQYTRVMLKAAIEGKLDDVEYEEDPVFGVHIPTEVPGIPSEVLRPRNTWDDKAAYDKQAAHLVQLFNDNFKEFQDGVSEEVIKAGPQIKEATA